MAYLGTKPANQVIDSTLIADGTITTNDLANQAVTQDKISSSAQFMGFKNRLINSDMRIDQRNAGASVTTANNAYTLDRWRFGLSYDGTVTVQQSSVAPSGFNNSLLLTVTSPDTSIGAAQFFGFRQRIEGYNVADLGWGTADAKTVTLSFWVRSSVTGTFVATLTNSADNRLYPATYTINSANTWEQKFITVAGDTTGTWLTDNGIGLQCQFYLALGSNFLGTANAWNGSGIYGPTGMTNWTGTSGATFYITGVQLEKGSVATSFDYRPYGTELALCQRYFIYPTWQSAAVYDVAYVRNSLGGQFPVVMRAAPSLVVASGGMSGHHGIAPAAAGTNVFNANFDWTGSATRDGAVGVVTFTASAEL